MCMFPVWVWPQVKELIRNSPRLVRTPLRDTQAVTTSKTMATPVSVKATVPPVKGKSRKRSSSENWLEHVPSSSVDNGDSVCVGGVSVCVCACACVCRDVYGDVLV